MKRFSQSRRISGAVIAFALLLGIVAGAFYFHAGNRARATNSVIPHPVTVKPHFLHADTDPGSAAKFKCQSAAVPVRCYGPAQIRAAYNIESVLDAGISGKGTTIVIIDAFQSPTIQHDLRLFDKTFGLHTPTLNIIAPDGLTPFNPKDPNQVSWSFEISLDVEWSHAIAPDATIDLVLAKSNLDADLLNVTKYAVDHNLGDALSQSFSEAEQCVDPRIAAQEHAVYEEAASKGISVFASSGDWGAAQFNCNGSTFIKSAAWPASDPLVTGVGGTSLNANPQSGQYHAETAWNDKFGASGGGFSILYPRPSYQSIVRNTQRGVPDIAFDADVNGGVLTIWSEGPGGPDTFYIAGGTSVGSPAMAGEIALVNQAFGHRLGNINIALYLSLGVPSEYFTSFNDIETGNNTFTGAGSNGKTVTIPGYNTHKNWDAVTGLGSLILGNTFFGIPGEGFRDR